YVQSGFLPITSAPMPSAANRSMMGQLARRRECSIRRARWALSRSKRAVAPQLAVRLGPAQVVELVAGLDWMTVENAGDEAQLVRRCRGEVATSKHYPPLQWD